MALTVDKKKMVAMIAAGLATFLDFVSICIVFGNAWFAVMALLAFLAGLACTAVHFADLLNDMGIITVSFLSNKKMVVLMILASGGAATFLAFLSFIGYTSALKLYAAISKFVGAYVCVVLSLAAHEAYIILALLRLELRGAEPVAPIPAN